MIELVLGAVGLFVAIVVIGAVVGSLSLVFWIVALPFKLIGLAFRALFLLPLLLPIGLVALALVGVALFLTLLPALPIVALVMLVWWLARGGRRKTVAA